MNSPIMWISGTLCLLFATVVGIQKFSDNDVKDTPGDKYELYSACATLIRSQVNMEMHASLVYMNMAAHFNRNSVARKGFSKLFEENSKEEREHAQKFIDYLNVRGSKFTDFNIDMPVKTSWNNALEAINDAIQLEKEVYNQIQHIHDIAETHCKDVHLMDFLEREFYVEQVESIDSLTRHASIIGYMTDTSVGEYLYDRELREEKH